MKSQFLRSRVITNKRLNSVFRHITLEALDKAFSFAPGQYITLRVTPTTFRCYSVCSSPDLLPRWELFVDITPQGPGTTYLSKLKKGEMVHTLAPSGGFTCAHDANARMVFAATGCGFAPYLPMVAQALHAPHRPAVRLFWGLRRKEHIAFRSVLDHWKRSFRNFSYAIILSQPAAPWRGGKGHVNEFLAKQISAPQWRAASVYLCGGGEFVQQNVDALRRMRFPLRRIHFENYS